MGLSAGACAPAQVKRFASFRRSFLLWKLSRLSVYSRTASPFVSGIMLCWECYLFTFPPLYLHLVMTEACELMFKVLRCWLPLLVQGHLCFTVLPLCCPPPSRPSSAVQAHGTSSRSEQVRCNQGLYSLLAALGTEPLAMKWSRELGQWGLCLCVVKPGQLSLWIAQQTVI